MGSKGEMPGSGSPLDLHPGHSVDRTMAGAAEAMASSLVPPPRGLASYAMEYGVSGMSVGAATCCTNPLDVIKVRLQLADFMQRRGMLATASGIVQQEGFAALFKGLSAALMRAGVYGGARLGFYGPMKSLLSPGKDPTFGTKLLAGMASGAAAAAIANPTDLIKVRLQAQKTGGAGGITPQYNGAVGAITHIVRAEGVLGLWRGVQPSMMRSAILTATQAATYDEAKRHVLKITGMKEGVQTHLGCSLLTGLVTTTVINPVEVVKNTMFTKGKECNMGPVATAGNIFAREGMRGLYKGWTANYARLGPQTTITFLVLEKLRSIAGLGTV